MSKRASKREYPSDSATTPLLSGQPKPSKSTPVSASKTIAFNSQSHLASHGHGVPTSDQYHTFPQETPAPARSKPKQPNRTTKTSQKLKLFPEEDEQTLMTSEDLDATVYDQIAQIPHGFARLEAERLSKIDRGHLPRVTAYCTASAYRMDEMVKFLQSKKASNGAAPKRFDECVFTPYSFKYPLSPPRDNGETNTGSIFPKVFLFDYGVVVFWGMTLEEEQKFMREIEPFEEERLETDDVEVEEFQFHYNEQYQPRIYNDVITLRHPQNYLVKLTISHAIAQSVKMTLFERLIDDTINETKYIPQVMAESGKVHMSRVAITKKIGQLFIMRINVNLVSNILDTPEIFWSEPALEPLYSAIRGYLEISQRVELLNQRVQVISDLLDMLKDHLNSSHGEQLEWIVIWLIAMEILVAVITTGLDAFSLSQK
ncbi:hypothetical protein K450DRAFT_217673 [Umbelopsis ramanniana AG]|uniref:DUF155 domain-containing protein n=1 Tax=Umbelopsis ramanniana AG TaxID=1314678 RepID=A0AAD5HJT6_UMBRA|nr:uncharacterized protein K450DRAFT_217673 [Umbelopsis ramanniana AG]KAI8584718.1 hypothetical protein K450DRAFT_217673 [Umbelopsis ramanniana AG]